MSMYDDYSSKKKARVAMDLKRKLLKIQSQIALAYVEIDSLMDHESFNVVNMDCARLDIKHSLGNIQKACIEIDCAAWMIKTA